MGTPSEQKLTLHGLKHAAGYIQRQLGTRLKTRFTPTIQFVLDAGVKQSIEITRLINEALGKTTTADQGEDEEAKDSVDTEKAPDGPNEGTANDRSGK